MRTINPESRDIFTEIEIEETMDIDELVERCMEYGRKQWG